MIHLRSQDSDIPIGKDRFPSDVLRCCDLPRSFLQVNVFDSKDWTGGIFIWGSIVPN